MFSAMSEAAENLVDDVGESYGLRWRRRSEVDSETCPYLWGLELLLSFVPKFPGLGSQV